jgi:hypothetical protein
MPNKDLRHPDNVASNSDPSDTPPPRHPHPPTANCRHQNPRRARHSPSLPRAMPPQRWQHRSPRQHCTPPQHLRRATPPVPQPPYPTDQATPPKQPPPTLHPSPLTRPHAHAAHAAHVAHAQLRRATPTQGAPTRSTHTPNPRTRSLALTNAARNSCTVTPKGSPAKQSTEQAGHSPGIVTTRCRRQSPDRAPRATHGDSLKTRPALHFTAFPPAHCTALQSQPRSMDG